MTGWCRPVKAVGDTVMRREWDACLEGTVSFLTVCI